MEKIHSPNAPKALGPYSHAVKSGQLLFISGQTPIDPNTMQIVSTDIAEQTLRALRNIELILTDAGLTLNNVVRTNVYLTDMAQFQAMNEVYAKVFADHKPARTTVSVQGLPLNALVEIDCVAEIQS